jgi:hypothetical protein
VGPTCIEREKRLETESDKWIPQSFAKILKVPQYSHVSTYKWARDVRNRVNSLSNGHLRELQKITPGVVDLHSENVKWYHFVHFATKVVVLCYSLAKIHMCLFTFQILQ